VRWLCCIALCAISCASPPLGPLGEERIVAADAERAVAPVADPELAVPSELESLLRRLETMRIAFVDPETFEQYRAAGPYEIVSWDHGELKLVGHDADGLGAVHLDVRTHTDSTWLLARIRDHEFLLRVD
jgi:hypothetical protein